LVCQLPLNRKEEEEEWFSPVEALLATKAITYIHPSLGEEDK